ncbi:PepSY domain-containing protein [Streptomyces sp. NPDC126497]|uniref:PepSY domain-containing protein n=1 Tax=Streptomyces sp. NPDC126497 TaxID=3155313 RepID=UPI00331EEC0C
MKRNIVIAVVTAAALVGGGTATALAVAGDDDGAASVTQTETRAGDDERDDERGDGRDERAVSGDVTAADAIAAALEHTPGTAVSAGLDDDDDGDGAGADGKAVWEVDVLGRGDTWHSVRVDPGSGKVLGAQKDDEDDTAEVRAALKGTSVTAEEAAKAAAAEGTVTSVELDDDGDKGWEAETRASGGDERDWRVAPGSGKVTADRDDDSDDD